MTTPTLIETFPIHAKLHSKFLTLTTNYVLAFDNWKMFQSTSSVSTEQGDGLNPYGRIEIHSA